MTATSADPRSKEDVRAYLDAKRHLVDEALDRHLAPGATRPAVIHEAMRYSVVGGGKRLRPILALATAEACGANLDRLIKPAAALELIHTYSLVHDDLPALDNDDLRRGRKTSHIVFGEAIAILAGDALLTEGFLWLSESVEGVDASRQLAAINKVASAVDARGMIGGQVADLEAEHLLDRTTDRETLRDTLAFIHENKTGRLLRASVALGAILGGASDREIDDLDRYARAIGLAFQIVDDLLDVEESAATLGKTAGKDLAQGKLTYPALFGIDQSRAEVQSLLDEAIGAAGMISGPVNYLASIARYVCERRS